MKKISIRFFLFLFAVATGCLLLGHGAIVNNGVDPVARDLANGIIASSASSVSALTDRVASDEADLAAHAASTTTAVHGLGSMSGETATDYAGASGANIATSAFRTALDLANHHQWKGYASGAMSLGTTTLPLKNMLEIGSVLQSTKYPGNMALYDLAAYNTALPGGGIMFGGPYRATSPYLWNFACVQGCKENATSNNLNGILRFLTSVDTDSTQLYERARFLSSGTFCIGSTTAPAGDLFFVNGNSTASGTFTVLGTFTHDLVWEDLQVQVGAINLTGAPAPATIDATNIYGSLVFSGSAQNNIAFVAQMPHRWKKDTSIIPHLHIAKGGDAAATGDVVWELSYMLYDATHAPTGYVMLPQIKTTVSAASNTHYLSEFEPISMTGYGHSTMVACLLSRHGEGGTSSDTLSVAVNLLGVDFHYQSDRGGSTNEMGD